MHWVQLPNATNYPMPQGPKPGQGGAPHTPTTLFPLKTIKGKGVGGTDPVPIVLLAVKGVQLIFSRGSSSRRHMLRRDCHTPLTPAKHTHTQPILPRLPLRNAKQRNAKQTVMLRVAHVIPGDACRMLPWDACVTCYSGAPMSHGGGIPFCVHDMRHFWYKTCHRGAAVAR